MNLASIFEGPFGPRFWSWEPSGNPSGAFAASYTLYVGPGVD